MGGAAVTAHASLDPLYVELTIREREVFTLAGNGVSNAIIAKRLGLSVKTIKCHRAAINKKLGIHRPAELVVIAARLGLVRAKREPRR